MAINIYVLASERTKHLLKEFDERFQKYWGGDYTPYISKTDLGHWSDGVIEFLNSIDDEYFILLHEDFYLTEPANLAEIERLAEFAQRKGADRVSLMGNHSPERVAVSAEYTFQYLPGMPYNYSFEASIQRREFLLEHLKPGENPWDAERMRNKEKVFGKVYCTALPAIFYGDKLRGGKEQDEIINPNIFE